MDFEEIHVFMYIDALPFKYVNPEYMPHLFSLLSKENSYIHTLQNIPGYSFGIQSTLLSGLLPQESFHWMPYMFIPENTSLFTKYGVKSICDNDPLLCSEVFRKALSVFHDSEFKNVRFLYEALLHAHAMVFEKTRGIKLHGIPPGHLEKILTFPYYYMNENPFFTMFKKEIAKILDMRVYYIGHSLSKNIAKLPTLLSMGKDASRLFVFEYIDDLDRIGHKMKVASRAWLDTLEAIDYFIFKVYRTLSAVGKQARFLIFSDHGMCNADEYIDLESLLLNKLPRGVFDYFIDATLAFIRMYKESLKDSVLKLLGKKLSGKALIFDMEGNRDILKQHGVYFADGEYGDIIVQTNPCKGFFPNFYSITRELIGLHGFWPSESVQQAFIVSLSTKTSPGLCKNPQHIREVKDFVLCNLSLG